MNRIVILCVAVFGLLSMCAAQFRPCQFTQVSHAERSEGIAISRVSWIEPSGEVGASVFIPDSSDPVPGIIFSHSAFHGAAANADLLGFAWALARAGAASIVLDGAIEWQTPNHESLRDVLEASNHRSSPEATNRSRMGPSRLPVCNCV